MKIQTIDTLTLGQFWQGVIPSKATSVQGTMDGACGPYALFNALVLGGHVSFAKLVKLWNKKPDGRSLLGKWQSDCGPLLLHGTDKDVLDGLLDALNPHLKGKSSLKLKEIISPTKGKPALSESVNDETLQTIQKFLAKENQPLLVGLAGRHINHWTVAVGFQTHSREDSDVLSRILLIDPSEPIPQLHAWNATLSLGCQRNLGLRYLSFSDPDEQKCGVDGAWSLEKL